MRNVVSNTTPIISLLKIGKLHLLRELYGNVFIPRAVFDEIEAGKNKEYYIDILKIEWLKVIEIQDTRSLSYFLDLDKGEAEAIVLAKEQEAELIILDETLGRFHAKHVGLTVTGTIGVLIKAKKLGVIPKLEPLLFELRNKNVWLSDSFIAEILNLA